MTNIEMDKRLFEYVRPVAPGLTVGDVFFALTADRELREAFLAALAKHVSAYEADMAAAGEADVPTTYED